MQHRSYTLSQVATIVKGKVVKSHADDLVIRDILIDSRQLVSPDQTLFFALVSPRNNGHKYLQQLFEKGVRSFVVSQLPANRKLFANCSFVLVNNTMAALQSLAAFHRSCFNIPVIGITGSNGKTIVKEWLFQLLNQGKDVIRSPKSYNSQIGVPLSVWQMDDAHELAIFEAGISEPDEMERLQQIIRPSIGVFTNIGQAHDENFIQSIQKAGEKLKLFTKVDVLVYTPDHTDIQEVFIKSGLNKRIRAFTWSRKNEADLMVTSIAHEGHQTRIQALFNQKPLSILIPFTDAASIENALHCWSVMLVLDIGQDVIAERMKHLTPIAMRLELKEGINNCTIINDFYNSDVNSLGIALDFLNQQNQHKDRTVILSDILQSGRNEVDLYGFIAGLLEAKGVTRIIGIGQAISRQADKFAIKKEFYPNTEAFISQFAFASLNNQTVLLKGARLFEFERISNLLQQKAHETVLEINLNNLIANLNSYRSKLLPGTRIMAMVKAFGYGSGSYEIANLLQFHHVDYLAVAYADEGVELRKAGISTPIMVMSPEENSFDAMIRHQLEPEIFSFRILGLLEETIARMALTGNNPVKLHLKLDTGMHRLGFAKDDLPELIERIEKNKMLYVQSVFSHLAASDKSSHDAFTHQQIALFTEMSDYVIAHTPHAVSRHILNSAGISRFSEAQFDMVRLGIGLYGIQGAEDGGEQLQTVLSLKSTITQIKTIPAHDSIGYNRSSIVDVETPIGIVPIGYADGLSRLLGNGKGSLWVNGKAAPIIGDVCMDMCMLNLSGIEASEGDTVVVFDDQHPIGIIAQDAQTIPYEILTRISRRVKRVYFLE